MYYMKGLLIIYINIICSLEIFIYELCINTEGN